MKYKYKFIAESHTLSELLAQLGVMLNQFIPNNFDPNCKVIKGNNIYGNFEITRTED